MLNIGGSKYNCAHSNESMHVWLADVLLGTSFISL